MNRRLGPNLQKYYPTEALELSLAAYDDVDTGAVRERRLKGWENVKRFHKMFVDAGGHLVVSGNLNDRYVPGLQLFQEMRVNRKPDQDDTVIFDGKVVDRRYHADYTTTFSPPCDGASAGPIVEALPWVAIRSIHSSSRKAPHRRP